MLRMSFMPCDFHPILLVLGDTDDLLNFSRTLRGFSKNGRTTSLNDAGLFSTDSTVTLSEINLDMGVKPGLWPSGKATGDLIWRIPKSYAAVFADDVADLANSGDLAGSALLECEVANEIKVKVSVGEWEDHYLTDDLR